jgi:hypothetical protein
MNQRFFDALCRTLGINPKLGRKIIDARYRPYLSALDDQYYGNGNAWDARANALNAAVKSQGIKAVKLKISKF